MERKTSNTAVSGDQVLLTFDEFCAITKTQNLAAYELDREKRRIAILQNANIDELIESTNKLIKAVREGVNDETKNE